MSEERPTHSKLGASSAERWMNCPGSVGLLKLLALDESDEPDYRREGTAGHEAAAYCLNEGLDTWEIVGQTFNNTVIDEPMAVAIQVYLDTVRQDEVDGATHWTEYGISSPVHPLYYGTLDRGSILPGSWLRVTDLKMGEGIIVEVDDNPQLKYYAFGLIDGLERQAGFTFDDSLRVILRIVQPRGFHVDGPVREWETTVGEIKAWVHDVLVPAMIQAELDDALDAGPWCRFCPAKLVCPMLTSLFEAAAKANPKHAVNLNDESLGRSYQYTQAVRFYIKALEEEAFKRLNLGREIAGTKLVRKKANRVFRSEAATLAKARFGADAMTKPELKSPAEMERISAVAKDFVKEWAYTPDTGLTVALDSDPRIGVKVSTTAEAFSEALANLKEDGQ